MAVAADTLQDEATEVLATLVRFDTVNPPGQERSAIEWLAGYLSDAGAEVELRAAEPERPSLVATLPGDGAGPTLGYLSHVDTVLADPADWTHDPWSGEVHDGFLWGRGSLDMKSQTAAEAVAMAVRARAGTRAGGALKLFCVADEEAGGVLGAKFLTEEHRELAHADFIVNEGGGSVIPYGDRRLYGVCTGEKGTFRFTVTARGKAGHASVPGTGENALLKLTAAIDALGTRRADYDLTEGPQALLEALGEDAGDLPAALERIRAIEPRFATLVEPTLGVTMVPTRISASEKINVIPARAELRVDCRVPPGMAGEATMARIREVLGDAADGLEVAFTERVVGNRSAVASPLMDAIAGWVAEADPGAEAVPTVLPAFTDSRWWRTAFPDCVAYGFFPHRHMTLFDTWPLIHSADERIDVRDLGLAAAFFHDLPERLHG